MEELDLKELFSIFWAKKLHIALLIAIFIVIGFIYSFVLLEPKYQSTTSILLAGSSSSQDGENTGITSTEMTLNKSLVSTYSELIKSKNILSEVIENLGIDKSEGGLKANISVSEVEDTDLIQISVVDADPTLAQRIAKEIAIVFIEKVANGVYKINNAQVWDAAEVPEVPYNINHAKDLLIFAVAGFVIACIYVLIANMLDTTVKSKEDIERKLGLTVLTSMPLCDFKNTETRKSKGGRRA